MNSTESYLINASYSGISKTSLSAKNSSRARLITFEIPNRCRWAYARTLSINSRRRQKVWRFFVTSIPKDVCSGMAKASNSNSPFCREFMMVRFLFSCCVRKVQNLSDSHGQLNWIRLFHPTLRGLSGYKISPFLEEYYLSSNGKSFSRSGQISLSAKNCSSAQLTTSEMPNRSQ